MTIDQVLSERDQALDLPERGSVWDSGHNFFVVTDVEVKAIPGFKKPFVKVIGDVISDFSHVKGVFIGFHCFQLQWPSLFLRHVSENSNWGAYYSGRIPTAPDLM